MLNAILLQHRISFFDDFGFTFNGKCKFTGNHICNLGMGMGVELTLCTFFKGVFHAHQIITVGQNTADHIFTAGLSFCILMIDPTFIFLCHINFLQFTIHFRLWKRR